MTTQLLRATSLVAGLAMFWTLFRADAGWWAITLIVVWGLLTGTWAFSAGWDAARGDDPQEAP